MKTLNQKEKLEVNGGGFFGLTLTPYPNPTPPGPYPYPGPEQSGPLVNSVYNKSKHNSPYQNG